MEEKTNRPIFAEMSAVGLLGVTISEAFADTGAGNASSRRGKRRGGFGLSLDDERASVVLDVTDRGLWLGGAKKEMPSQTRPREWVGSFRLMEPDAGSGPDGTKTRAEISVEEYQLTDPKKWILNSPVADMFFVWTKLAAHNDQIRGVIL
jgi:glutaryl-CoA dehydrogenase